MMNTRSVIQEFLKQTGAAEPITMGTRLPQIKVSAEMQAKLVTQLEQTRATSTRFAIIAAVAHFFILFIAIGFAYYFRDSSTVVTTLLGGSTLTLLVIATRLVALWREKTTSDILITILPNLSPEEAIRVLESIYYKSLEATSKK
jgi:hypothetical protein